MKRTDRELGMHRDISRRDILQGFGTLGFASAATGALSTTIGACPAHAASTKPPSAYPPALSGLRGSHDGAFETAHALGRDGQSDFGPSDQVDTNEYDLVVVGAGMSGLSAAYFFLQEKPNARVLILENHDDFGGHAKRNEFQHKGRTILGHGGSQTIDTPSGYSDVAMGLLKSLAIDVKKFESAYDHDFYKRHKLTSAFHFDEATFKTDKLVKIDLMGTDGAYIPLSAEGTLNPDEAALQMPIAPAAQQQLANLWQADTDHLPDHWIWSEPGYLMSISYLTFLKEHMGVTHPQAIRVLQDLLTPLYAHGMDAIPALEAFMVYPGLNATSLGKLSFLLPAARLWGADPYISHFPDGNISVVRQLVRRLMPHVAEGETMEDVVLAHFDYGKLDMADAQTRLRLNSTVVNVTHKDPKSAKAGVDVTYVRHGQTERISAKQCVMACYNMIIPHICPDLPDAQKEGLAWGVKAPLVYTNVLLDNWRAWEKLGVGLVESPGRWHTMSMLDFPVSLGDYEYSQTPDDPIVIHMVHVPTSPGHSPADQARAGRHRLLSTSFEDFEREVRDHLTGMLGDGGFDPARDIAGITVNRHAHGYARAPNPLFDPDHDEGKAPHEIGRLPFGNITIANSDAGAKGYFDVAIDQGHRAVQELLST